MKCRSILDASVTLWLLTSYSAGCVVAKAEFSVKKKMEFRTQIDHGNLTSILEVDRNLLSSSPEQFIHATFTVRNNTEGVIPIIFRSGQQYDFYLEDETGRQHWKWSEGRFFSQAITTKQLAKEPWVYEERVPTVDRYGKPLPAGNYLLRARHVGEPGVENSIGFRIQ